MSERKVSEAQPRYEGQARTNNRPARYVWTSIGAAVGAILLLSLVMNLADPTIHPSGLVIAMYLGVVAGIVAGGVKLDRRRSKV